MAAAAAAVAVLRAPRADLVLFPPRETVFRQEHGWISTGYGLRRPAPVLVYAVRAVVPLTLRTDLVLVPHQELEQRELP